MLENFTRVDNKNNMDFTKYDGALNYSVFRLLHCTKSSLCHNCIKYFLLDKCVEIQIIIK